MHKPHHHDKVADHGGATSGMNRSSDVSVINATCVLCGCSFYDLVMEMIADRSSAVLDVESDVKLCSIKVSSVSVSTVGQIRIISPNLYVSV